MHIIAILTALAGLIWALHSLQRSGLDLNALNPFLWMRRREWEKKRATRPVFALAYPIEAASVLILAVAREGSELLQKDRERIVDLYMTDLKMSERQAREMLAVNEHMLREGPSLLGEIGKVLAPSRDKFSQEQKASLVSLLHAASGTSPPMPRQQQLIGEVQAYFQNESAQAAWQR
ncbi:MAG TPA: hypothetical protein VJM11_11380 [Nevskiaceae bacterium]|nr:hypothetical protein [Nevskiaceae bacterium]